MKCSLSRPQLLYTRARASADTSALRTLLARLAMAEPARAASSAGLWRQAGRRARTPLSACTGREPAAACMHEFGISRR